MVTIQKSKKGLLVVAALFAIYFIWGTTYLSIAYALKGFKPFTISGLRFLSAGIILSAWLYFKKAALPPRSDIKVLVISGVLMLSGGSGLLVVGEQYISSGAAAVIMATEPLFFVLLDRRRWKSYFSNRMVIAGIITGFVGIALFSYLSPEHKTAIHPRPLYGTLITLASAVSWVVGVLYANRKLSTKASSSVYSAAQLIFGGICSMLVAGLVGEWPALFQNAIPAVAWAGIAYLVIMGSLVAYISFNWLTTVQSPAVVSTHTYVNPVIAILMGWMLAAEAVTGWQLASLVLVLAGVLMTQLNRSGKP